MSTAPATRGRPLRALLWPWWALSLLTGAKAFSDNPLIGSARLNRLGLHAGRVRLAARLGERRRRRLRPLVSAEDAQAFDRDGYVLRRDFLPPAAFAALRDQVLGHAAPAREMRQGDTVTRRIAVDRAMLRACPALAALLRDRTWRGLLRYAWSFRAEPLFYVQSILSHVADDAPDPQTALHADTFHPTVKAWLFLTDVAADGGPFVYVPGSHRMTPQRLAWERRRSVEVLDGGDRLSVRGSLRVGAGDLPALGLPDPVAFAVPANTLVVADTSGFHARGPSARPSVRVEIWAYGRRNPFLPWAGLDMGSLPGVAWRRVGWMWGLRDRFERVLGQPWRAVGPTRPDAPVRPS